MKRTPLVPLALCLAAVLAMSGCSSPAADSVDSVQAQEQDAQDQAAPASVPTGVLVQELPEDYDYVSYVTGTELTQSDVVWFRDQSGLYGLMSLDGTVIKEPFAASGDYFNQNTVTWYQAEKDGLYGLVNKEGQIIKEPFAATDPYISQYDVVLYKETSDGLFSLMDKDGNVIKESFAKSGYETEEPVFWYQVEKDGPFGLMDRAGNVVREPFASPDLFNENNNFSLTALGEFNEAGLAAFTSEKDGPLGIVNEQGELLSDGAFPFLGEVSGDGSALWYSDEHSAFPDQYGLAKPDGEIIREPFSYYTSDFTPRGVSWYYPQGMPGPDSNVLVGLVNTDGEIVREAFSASSRPFDKNGVAWFRSEQDGPYGLVNDAGEVVKEPFCFYASGNNFGEGNRSSDASWFQAEEDGLWGLINDQGEIIKDPFLPTDTDGFDENGIGWYSNLVDTTGMDDVTAYRAQQTAPVGMVTKEGDVLSDPIYQHTTTFNNGRAIAQRASDGRLVMLTLEYA